MKTLSAFRAASLIAALTGCAAFGQQNTLTQTSLSAASAAGSPTIVVASATNIAVTSATSNGAMLYIVDPGERTGQLVKVTSVTGTTIGVRSIGNHVSGAMVLVGQPQWFNVTDPSGSCVTANTYVTPWLNTNNGNQWLCSTVTLSWVPGWNNTTAPAGATLAVASTAGTITPTGPLFTVSGTSAITGFVSPVGFNKSGGFCMIPTGTFTWTTGDASIGLAGTAVVGKVLCFTYDQASGKWYPDYIA